MNKSDKVPDFVVTWIDVEAEKPARYKCYGDFWHSEPVLVTDGYHRLVGYFQTWNGGEYISKWKLAGPDGYTIDNVTHWAPLPPLPIRVKPKTSLEDEIVFGLKSTTEVHLEPEGLEGIEKCVDCHKPSRYWVDPHTPLCKECAEKRSK